MCGIAGIFAYRELASPVEKQELLRVSERMVALGPGSAGIWIAPDHLIGLTIFVPKLALDFPAHARTSI